MSDAPPPDQSQPSGEPVQGGPVDPAEPVGPVEHVDLSGPEVTIDLTAFLPEGVELAGEPGVDAETDGDTGPTPDAGHHAEPDVDLTVPVAEQPVTEQPVTEQTLAEQPVAEQPEDAVDLELLDSVEQDLAAVDAAISALDDGSYGTCASCGRPIPVDNLSVDPVRRTCAQHA